MATTFHKALEIAQARYPHRINYYEEYEKYYVFGCDDGREHVGGDFDPIVIRKSDAQALNYAPIFFNFSADAEDVGDVIAQGTL